MEKLDTFQKYLVEEFYDDYREGLITRRTFIRRVAFITGSIAAASVAMLAAGCQPIELPAPTEAMPVDATPTAVAAEVATPASAPAAASPFSVPEDDPAVQAADVTFDSQGDTITAYQARPAEDGVYPAVLVCHENRGLTPHIRDVARRFAKEGYVALAVDLLSREGGTAAHEADAVPGLLTDAGAGRHVADFVAAAEYLQGLEFVDPDRIGMIGFCFGGGITWRVATALPTLKAAVPFYGPAPELDQVPNIKAAVFGVYAELDERIGAGVPDLEAALKDAGTTYQIKIYPGVNHAFHNDTGERYDEEQATQAWLDTLAWFEQVSLETRRGVANPGCHSEHLPIGVDASTCLSNPQSALHVRSASSPRFSCLTTDHLFYRIAIRTNVLFSATPILGGFHDLSPTYSRTSSRPNRGRARQTQGPRPSARRHGDSSFCAVSGDHGRRRQSKAGCQPIRRDRHGSRQARGAHLPQGRFNQCRSAA